MIYDIVNNKWTIPKLHGNIIPVGKSGHTATLHEDSMFVFGGHNVARNQESYAYSGWKVDEKIFKL